MIPMSRCKKHGICKHETKVVCTLCAAENSGTQSTDTQQLKAEIRSAVTRFCNCAPVLVPQEIDVLIKRLNELSAV